MPGARTPEELETLLEDACILSDREAVTELFEQDGIVGRGGPGPPESPAAFIVQNPPDAPDHGLPYLPPTRILSTGGLAVSVGPRVNVFRRGLDGFWRVAISVMDPNLPPNEKGQDK